MIDEERSAVSTPAPSVAAPAATALLLHSLSDRSRLAIVEHLFLGEHRVVDLTRHLGLAQSTVSKHLMCLLDCGIVAVRREGRASVYSLAHPGATRALLAAAEDMLTLVGGSALASADRVARHGGNR